MSHHYTLGGLISTLEGMDQTAILTPGISHPHSYRGYYHELAFEPTASQSVGEALAVAKGAVGQTFEGWKGGEYTMGAHTDVWFAEMGDVGSQITSLWTMTAVEGTGTDLIVRERRRQVEAEGYTREHDVVYINDELRLAAASYLLIGHLKIDGDDASARFWPWGREGFKPGDDIRNLVKAGALIAAEIDRLLALQAATS